MTDYSSLSDSALIDRLFIEEDRLPREAVDDFLRRGARMSRPLAAIILSQEAWTMDFPTGWGVVHATYILGALGGEDAVIPLLRGLRWAEAYDNDWVWERLPAIFAKVGAKALPLLRYVTLDRTSGWLTRCTAMESMAALTVADNKLDTEVFAVIRDILTDPSEDTMVRQTSGFILLDFARVEYRAELIQFALMDEGLKKKDKAHPPGFTTDEVEDAFNGTRMELAHYTADWLEFYNETNITKRQEQWLEEAQEELQKKVQEKRPAPRMGAPAAASFIHGPRDAGRNAPCPCGSGKKYRVCCSPGRDTLH